MRAITLSLQGLTRPLTETFYNQSDDQRKVFAFLISWQNDAVQTLVHENEIGLPISHRRPPRPNNLNREHLIIL